MPLWWIINKLVFQLPIFKPKSKDNRMEFLLFNQGKSTGMFKEDLAKGVWGNS